MDFPTLTEVYRGQLTDQALYRHAGAGEYESSVPIRHFNSEPKRNLCDFSRLQGAVIGHIHIRSGIVAVRTKRALILRYAKVLQSCRRLKCSQPVRIVPGVFFGFPLQCVGTEPHLLVKYSVALVFLLD